MTFTQFLLTIKSMNSTKSGLLGILGLIVGVLVIFFVLNYFNILSLSTIYPNLFGSLPHKTNQKNTTAIQQEAFAIRCPVTKQYCLLGKSIKHYYSGLGYNLPEGTDLLSTFDGDAKTEFGILGNEKLFNEVIIKNSNGVEAHYLFQGNVSLPKRMPTDRKNFESSVLSQEKIASISGELLKYMYATDQINLFFYVLKDGKSLELKPIDLIR